MSSISLKGLGLVYPKGATGLDDITLEIADGEFITLVGPSGSGKTTLLRAIAGFLRPDTGSIAIGADLVAGPTSNVPPERRALGMVFQQHAIWPHWNVGKNVAYPLRMAGVARAERDRRVTELLALVGLPGFIERNPATLSGGQRQRVALARALAGSPRVLLLDEALSALDEPLRARLRVELRALTKSIGLTVVHVTHDRAEALALADRVVVLNRGAIEQIGTPDELVRRPSNPFVASFLWDATIVPGHYNGSGFVANDHPCRVVHGAVDVQVAPHGSREPSEQGDRVAGRLAIMPDGVTLHSQGSASHLTDDEQGIVVSSLYGRDGSDVVVTWQGLDVRCTVAGRRPSVGEYVGIAITHALFYPDAPEQDASGADPCTVLTTARAEHVTA